MLGRTSGGFCDADIHLSFFFIHIFFLTSFLTLPWTIVRILDRFCTFSPAHRKWFAALLFSTIPLFSYHERYSFEWTLFTHGRFLPYAPSRYFGTTCFYQGFPGSRQLFLEIFRASYWSSKHRPSPSVSLIHSNPQLFIHLKFVFIHVNVAKIFTCGENFDKKYRSAATLFSSHEDIKQQPN